MLGAVRRFDGSFPDFGAFGFRCFRGPVWVIPIVGPNCSLLRRYFLSRWRSLTENGVVSSDWCFCYCIWLSSFAVMWIAIVIDFSFHQQVKLCLCKHTCLRTCIHLELRILYIRETRQKWNEIIIWQLPFLKFAQGTLFAFPDGLLPVKLGVYLALPSSLPFPSPFEFWCVDHVGAGERGRPFPLPCLFGSCSDVYASPTELCPCVIDRMQSSLSKLYLALSLTSSCFTFDRSSFCKSVLVDFSHFLLDMSLGHLFQFARIVFCRQM